MVVTQSNHEKYLRLSPESRVWIYQSNKPFDKNQQDQLAIQLDQFAQQWTAHNQALAAPAEIFHHQFPHLSPINVACTNQLDPRSLRCSQRGHDAKFVLQHANFMSWAASLDIVWTKVSFKGASNLTKVHFTLLEILHLANFVTIPIVGVSHSWAYHNWLNTTKIDC